MLRDWFDRQRPHIHLFLLVIGVGDVFKISILMFQLFLGLALLIRGHLFPSIALLFLFAVFGSIYVDDTRRKMYLRRKMGDRAP